jgi:predicted nucleic acid-binding protein
VIAVDAGFIYALVDPKDAWHARAAAFTHTAADEGWITTWPALTEASHLLAHRLGVAFAAALMDDVAEGAITLWEPPADAVARMAAPMRKYASLPMDLADASLMLLAEHLGHGRILSTDMRDFGAYRWKNRKPFRNLLEAPR